MAGGGGLSAVHSADPVDMHASRKLPPLSQFPCPTDSTNPQQYKSFLHMVTVLSPSHSKVQTLLTGQTWDAPGESLEGLLNKMVHFRNQRLPHLRIMLPVPPSPLSIPQITGQDPGCRYIHDIVHAPARCACHLCSWRHLPNGWH